jgi:hypothetical protein
MFLDLTKLAGFYIAGTIRAWLTKYTNLCIEAYIIHEIGHQASHQERQCVVKSRHYWFRTFGVPPFGSTPALLRRQNEADYFSTCGICRGEVFSSRGGSRPSWQMQGRLNGPLQHVDATSNEAHIWSPV